MKEIRKCPDCLQKTSRLVRGRYVGEAKHDGRTHRIDLPDLQFYRCENCHAEVLPDEADRQIGRELRRLAGLLMPEEIRDARVRAGFSQKTLAEFLNVAEATVCRWETGGQIQQGGYDNSIRSFFCVPGVAEFYGSLRDGNRHPITVRCAVVTTCTTKPKQVAAFWGQGDEADPGAEEESSWWGAEETEWSPAAPSNRIRRFLPVCAGR